MSLSVEEQFYIIFVPLFIVFLRHIKALTILMIFGFIFSILASELSLMHSHKGSYYLLHFRAFELLQGCLLALHFDKNSEA